jgi:hypothetical protein
MLETLIASLFTLDLSLLLIIINRITKSYQPYMTQKQEEELHQYQEHQKGWEFKILRTGNDGFRRHELLKLVCQEELDSGWILLEKLDDSRLRFRRPVKFRERDHLAKLDPYRSFYGKSGQVSNFVSVALLLLFMSIPVFFGFAFMQTIFKSIRFQNPLPTTKTNAKPQTPVLLTPKPTVRP